MVNFEPDPFPEIDARKIAIALDQCLRALGQARHIEMVCPRCIKLEKTDARIIKHGAMEIDTEVRRKVISEGYAALSKYWRNK